MKFSVVLPFAAAFAIGTAQAKFCDPAQLKREPLTAEQMQSITKKVKSASVEILKANNFDPNTPTDAPPALKVTPGPGDKDLRDLLWASIDNFTSKDLDQLSVATQLPNGGIRLQIGIADVDFAIPKGSKLDAFAFKQTTSLYGPASNFPMLPRGYSEGLTSMFPDVDRFAMVYEMDFDGSGKLLRSDIYRAVVRSKAKLVYELVAPWLEGKAGVPADVAKVKGLAENLKLQDKMAQILRKNRFEAGGLEFSSNEVDFDKTTDHLLSGFHLHEQNRAHQLVEEEMVAANQVVAKFLYDKGLSALHRIVRTPDPEKWQAIVEIVKRHRGNVPGRPDGKALSRFLNEQRQKDPQGFPELSKELIVNIGAGEYVAVAPGETPPGHFNLGIKFYAHSTAPNRRFPDVVIQRQLKAAVAGNKSGYSAEEVRKIAEHITQRGLDVKKADRALEGTGKAFLLEPYIGSHFNAILTSDRGKAFARIIDPPARGLLRGKDNGAQDGDELCVVLDQVDTQKGFLDFSIDE